MVPSLMSLGALKPYGDSLGERSSELLRICLLRTLTPRRGIQDQIFMSLVLVMAPFPGPLGLDGHTGYHSGGLGRQEGESGSIRERSGPSFGRAAVPQRAVSDFRL